MSIQKKSLISALKTTKKANVAEGAKGEKLTSMKLGAHSVTSTKGMKFSSTKGLKISSTKGLKISNTKGLKFSSAKKMV
jgi:hypothetical protein